jgi:predicted RNase H-like HicB family nuclease
MLRYTVLVYEDPEEHNFGVVVPELPGCVTQAESFDQALANAREAIEGHLLAMSEHGDEIPEEFGIPITATAEVDPDLTAAHSNARS